MKGFLRFTSSWRSLFGKLWVITLIFATCPALTRTVWAADGGFEPLFGATGLDHAVGDKGAWSLHEGVLTGHPGPAPASSTFLLKIERFGNFILKFRVRANDPQFDVLFRATIQPPGQLIGYVAEIGGQHAGTLQFRKPGPMFIKPKESEPGHAAPGFPDAVGIPFVEKAYAETTLVSSDSANVGVSSPSGQWVEYEISGLGDHLLTTVNGKVTAHYRVKDRWPEGMIGFRLPPEMAGSVEIQDLQVKVLGEVTWPEEAPLGNLTEGHSAEGWKASPPDFHRVTDEEWSEETRQLLNEASHDEGYRSLYDGKDLQGWHTAATFWTSEDGTILGEPRNVFLVTDKDYSDFILKGSLRLTPPGGNSGIQIRSAVIPDGMRGDQYDVGIPWWGQIYGESTTRGIMVPVDDRMKRVALVHADGWNDYVIICKGDHLIGVLNGQVTYDFVDYYGEKTGLIGLQIHAGAAMKVYFKDLRLRELP